MSRSPVPQRLRTRLFLSHLLVVVTGAIVMVGVGTVVTRTVYERRVGGLGLGHRQGRGSGDTVVTPAQLEAVLDESLLPAMFAGVAAALVAAGIVAWWLGNRLLRPLDDVRAATRRMAAGDYRARVPVPSETELALLAHDVNELGSHLATTEQRRVELLAEVTHELRTPITVVQGQMEGMLDGVIAPSGEVFAAVAGEAARMRRLVEDLSTLSRADEGSLDLQVREVDLSSVAEAASRRLRPQFEHADVRLATVVTGPVRIAGDPDRLAQIITNLLGNALAHTPAGGSVTVTTTSVRALGVLEVEDSGEGIPEDELDRIFERFHRLPGAGHSAGRGLGLTIARGLARALGGDLTAHSEGPGHGSRFRLTVPLVD